MKLFVGVDIGTTGIRAGVYDESFRLLGTGSAKAEIIREAGEITQDPDEMYQESARAVRDALGQAGERGEKVAGISFDGQMAGIMGIGERWNAVTPYDSWLDTRCSSQVEEMKRKALKKIIEKTGNIPSYNHGPKMLWWKENEPEAFRKVSSFIQPGAYAAGRLCRLSAEDAFVDWTYLHFSGFADNGALKWDEELLDIFSMPREKLPEIVSPFSVVGRSAEGEAERFGISSGVAVSAGCGDTASCFLGTGAVEERIAVDVAGTASVFALAVGAPLFDAFGTVYAARSVLKDLWYSMSYINGGGLNLEWFRHNFAPESSFDELNKSIERVNAGSDGLIFIPHLEGRGYPNVPNMRGHWKGFTRDHGRAHFYRSVLEGIGYEYAVYKESIMRVRGSDLPFDVRVVGGGAKSAVWNRIKADILGNNYCTIDREDISTLGQAIIASVATGSVRDVREAARRAVKVYHVHRFDKKNHEIYAACLKEYKELLESYVQ